MLFTPEAMALLLSSYFPGSHRLVLRSRAGSSSRPTSVLGDRDLCGSGTVTVSTNPFWGDFVPVVRMFNHPFLQSHVGVGNDGATCGLVLLWTHHVLLVC